jgi:hypothetical protein
MVLATPLPERAPAPKSLAGKCNHGEITQTGDQVYIEGPCWIGAGRIHADGKLWLVWVRVHDGYAGLGVYSIEGDRIRGRWGWRDQVEILGNGTLDGNVHDDELIRSP